MAQRDRSQGFGFMYVNIAKVLEERKTVSAETTAPVSTQNVYHTTFNKTEKSPPQKGEQEDRRPQAIAQIKENLDRLQSLHHRLHAMLEELNKISSLKRGK